MGLCFRSIIVMQTGLSPALAAMLLAGCGGGSGGLTLAGSVASYAAANVISPAGHSEKQSDDTHFTVMANGTASTPKERAEKIAMARAAEIGTENKLDYFKVLNVSHSVNCGKKYFAEKGVVKRGPPYPSVAIDVEYSKTALDPSFRPSKETFQQLKGELDSETVPPDAAAAAAEGIKAQCGAG